MPKKQNGRGRRDGARGRFRTGKNAWFAVSRSRERKRILNEAGIEFESTDEEGDEQIQKHAIRLPDGEASWAAAWIRDAKVLWIVEKDSARQYDFSDPAEIEETGSIVPTSATRFPSGLESPAGRGPVRAR